MKTHTIGTDTYAIFEKSEKGNLMMLHFIWGKKDFRLFLEDKSSHSAAKGSQTALISSNSGELLFTHLQYLNNFQWYEYDKVAGHGLAHDEVRWKTGDFVRYVELPQHFHDVAVELACLEFNLKRKNPTAAAV